MPREQRSKATSVGTDTPARRKTHASRKRVFENFLPTNYHNIFGSDLLETTRFLSTRNMSSLKSEIHSVRLTALCRCYKCRRRGDLEHRERGIVSVQQGRKQRRSAKTRLRRNRFLWLRITATCCCCCYHLETRSELAARYLSVRPANRYVASHCQEVKIG